MATSQQEPTQRDEAPSEAQALPATRGRILKRTIAIAVALVAVAGLSLGIVNTVMLNKQAHKIVRLQRTVATQGAQISSLNDEVSLLEPLSKYTGTLFISPKEH